LLTVFGALPAPPMMAAGQVGFVRIAASALAVALFIGIATTMFLRDWGRRPSRGCSGTMTFADVFSPQGASGVVAGVPGAPVIFAYGGHSVGCHADNAI
jgi:hypothetical protein